jgi:hypothetical protein
MVSVQLSRGRVAGRAFEHPVLKQVRRANLIGCLMSRASRKHNR